MIVYRLSRSRWCATTRCTGSKTDQLGRPEGITNQNKQRQWRAAMRPFDRKVIDDFIGGFHLGFPGQYHDTETGYACNIHRDYDPGTGRYLQSDPIGLAGGINTYSYGLNNPVSVIDPLGLQGFFIPSPGGSMPYESYRGASSDAVAYGMNMCIGACANMNTYLGGMIEGAGHLMFGLGAERALANVSSAAIKQACAAGALGAAICTGKLGELDGLAEHLNRRNQFMRDSENASQCRIGTQQQFPYP